jgi:hypothetical protein
MSKATARSVLRDVVFHQLDDLNALGDALLSASADGDPVRVTTVLDTIDRLTVALGWQTEAVVPSVLAYVDARSRFEDDLFAPALALDAIASERPETQSLLARLTAPVRDLLALAGRRLPPRPG